jgi:MFS family permease
MDDKRFYGWKLVSVLFLLYLGACFVIYGGNIANTFMAKITNMPRALYGAGYAAVYLFIGIGSAIAAMVVNKKGERFTLALGMGIVTLGSLLMATLVNGPIGYILSFGLIIGIGFAFATVLPMQTIITKWFVKKRALATSLVLTAGGIGGIIGAPLFNSIIEKTHGNWRLVWFILVGLTFSITIIAIFTVKNDPSVLGQKPDGFLKKDSSSENESTKKINKKGVYQTTDSWELKEALKTRSLWFILVAASAQFVAFYLCIGHGVIHLMDLKFTNATASFSLGLLAFASIGGRLLSGVLGDRFEPKFVIGGGLCCTSLGLVAIMFAKSIVFIYIYSILAGLGFGLVYVCLFTILGNYYGSKTIQNFLGLLIPIVTLFGAASPLIAGLIKDQTGSYMIAFIGAAVGCILGILAILSIQPPQKAKA